MLGGLGVVPVDSETAPFSQIFSNRPSPPFRSLVLRQFRAERQFKNFLPFYLHTPKRKMVNFFTILCAAVSAGIDKSDCFDLMDNLGFNCSETSFFRAKRDGFRKIRKCCKTLKKRGKKGWWTRARDERLCKVVNDLQGDPEFASELCASDLKRRLKIPLSASSIRRRMNKLGFRWRRPIPMVDLCTDDVEIRRRFCLAYKDKGSVWWGNTLCLDSKKFQSVRGHAERLRRQRQRVRGVWRKKGDKSIGARRPRKYDLQAPSPMNILGGVCKGRVILWHRYQKFNSEVFCKAVGAVCDKYGVHRVLLDMHKVHTSKATQSYFEKKGIELVYVPPRSPDLSPCDYGLWNDIERRLMPQVAKMKGTVSHETYQSALFKVAKSTDENFVKGLVSSMKSRISKTIAAKGARFQE